MKQVLKDHRDFPEYKLADIASIKALYIGEASPDQQKRGLEFIMKKMANISGSSFDSDPATYGFKEGKRKIGIDLAYILATPIDVFKPKKRNKK